MRRYTTLGLVLLAACAERPVRTIAERSSAALPQPVQASATVALPSPAASFVLPIPARSQAPDAPPAGWCGETAIQEALLHLGVWAPQRAINKAGRPSHPDLYSPDIPVALTELGVKHVFYTGRGGGFEAYARWVRTALDAGDPVLAGAKILPTAHPEWGLDHFVLVVGHGEKGLLVNTTWGTRQWVTDRDTQGISFQNAFYAIRLLGLRPPRSGEAGATRARLAFVSEAGAKVTVALTCSGLDRGARYRVERRDLRGDDAVRWSEDVSATGDRVDREVELEADAGARFRCVRL